ncbi:phage tail protein [Xenorhabdus sp. Sc-CR9]|uniref:phage tail protein n=1 Tax=Xenorhabdus sp. Sc-CR9 TaxID=2584468 RepID=UPI001F271B2B|nr:phage tail protein [Xenorhabdus sp. Sc-CR9]
MTTKYFALLTRLGADKLANAAALGTKLNITHMAVGDGGGTLPTPDTTQTRLVNERRRAAINVLSVDPKNTHQIIAEQVIPESEGGWWIREIGLFDKDGILIAVGNCAETYKPQLQEGSGRTQTIRMVLIVSHTEAVTLKIDPSVVLATREYADAVVKNAINEHEKSRRHPDATLREKGFVVLSNAVDSNSETQAATPKAVKAAYDVANAANNNANGRVPAGRKVNGKALHADISLNAGDVGAYNKGETDARVNEAKNLANARLEKSKNGADIPNKDVFVKNLGLGEGSALPVGVPVPWPLEIPPTGWLKCNGSTFDREKYPKLTLAYPSGVLPDLRGEFIRGWSEKRNVDRGRMLLSSQDDSFKAHDHFFSHSWAATGLDPTGGRHPVGADAGGYLANIAITTEYSGGPETRPRNIAFNYIVRAA